MQSIMQLVLEFIDDKGGGYVFTPTELSYLPSRSAVDQALSRLVRRGTINRLGRGVYAIPESNPLVGEVPPSASRVAEALARATGAHLQVSEAAAANEFGLATQVPGRLTYWTDGSPRTRRIGSTVIQLKRGSPRRLAGAGRAAGAVVQALRYLGPRRTNSTTIARLREHLPESERQSLREIRNQAPEWMRAAIDRIAGEDNG
ncbi:MAG: DUF6088 family protein [Gemmatimonadales bacterium]